MPDKKPSDPFFYPVTPETMHKYAESIFAPIRRGECVTTVWVPMAGRRMRNKFVIENIALFEKELPEFRDYLLVYVEPLELTEESMAGYIYLMAKSLINACQNNDRCVAEIDLAGYITRLDGQPYNYSSLLAVFKEVTGTLVRLNITVVFFLGEFDELSFTNQVFYNNLKSIWTSSAGGLKFVFLMREQVETPEKVGLYSDFCEVILQNVLYIPLLAIEDYEYVFKSISAELNVSPTEEQFDLIKELCDSHPYLTRVALRLCAKNSDLEISKLRAEILDYYEIRSVGKGVLESLPQTSLKFLEGLAKGDKVTSIPRELLYLEKLGFCLVGEGGYYQIAGKILENTLVCWGGEKVTEVGIKGSGLGFDEASDELVFEGKPVDEKFTRQEHGLLELLLKKKEHICTRDEIGNVLWGDNSYEKYSDWAIDQIISKTRKKMKELKTGNDIITLRGKGYKIS